MYKLTIMEERLNQVKQWLKEGYSRIEAVEKLAEKEKITINTAKMIVYTAFPGAKYSQRRRRWKRNPLKDIALAPPLSSIIDVDNDDELDL